MSRIDEYMRSPAGAQAGYRKRKRHRVRMAIFDIEPQSKNMSATDRRRFQTAVAEYLTEVGRGPSRGGIVLKLNVATTNENAPQAHTIAKNLLDLLSDRGEGVDWPRHHLLYRDDRQIQALSVSCRHGEDEPTIRIEARPMTAMLADLEVATLAIRKLDNNSEIQNRHQQENEWVEAFGDLVQNEVRDRRRLGNERYDAYLKMLRASAQAALLGRGAVSIPVLTWMYGRPEEIPATLDASEWVQSVTRSSLRLQVGGLPVVPGSSAAFRQRIAEEIATFRTRWDWIMNPLVVAVALEVIVRLDADTPDAVLHDLDNAVRDYLLPAIMPQFDIVSDHRWTIDFEDLRRREPDLAARWGSNPTPPVRGVTRYDVWRLPAVAGQPGFVSVALVADMDGAGGMMEQVDRNVDLWVKEDSTSRFSRRRRR